MARPGVPVLGEVVAEELEASVHTTRALQQLRGKCGGQGLGGEQGPEGRWGKVLPKPQRQPKEEK